MHFRGVLASVGCSLPLVTSAAPADAASPIQLGKIQYNSPGSLRTASGTAIDYCAWTSNGSGYKYC